MTKQDRQYHKLFVQFLKTNNCFDEFMYNVKCRKETNVSYSEHYTKHDYGYWISDAFHWPTNMRANVSWLHINSKWRKLLRAIDKDS